MRIKDRRFSIPFCALEDGLTDKQFLLLCFLFSRSDCSGKATLSYKEMMDGAHIGSRNTVAKCLKALKEHGWFDYVRRRGWRPNTFFLEVPEIHQIHNPRPNIVYLMHKAKKARSGRA